MQYTEEEQLSKIRFLEKQIVCLQTVAEKANQKEAQVVALTGKLKMIEAERVTKDEEFNNLLDQYEFMGKQMADLMKIQDEQKDFMIDRRMIIDFIV